MVLDPSPLPLGEHLKVEFPTKFTILNDFRADVSGAIAIGWLRLVGSFKSLVSFVQEPYKREDILFLFFSDLSY